MTSSTSDPLFLLKEISSQRSKEAFSSLFIIYAPKILSYGISKGLSDSQARDLVQEVMTLVWTKAHLFDAKKGQPNTWIFTIARNVRFDLLRVKSREDNFLTSQDIWSESFEHSSFPQTLPDDQVLKSQLHKSIDSLPLDQKLVVQSIYVDGLTQEEFSRNNQIPLGTVKSRLRLAIEKLNDLMGKNEK